jgi:peptide/nickel transport system substrate-binding protein
MTHMRKPSTSRLRVVAVLAATAALAASCGSSGKASSTTTAKGAATTTGTTAVATTIPPPPSSAAPTTVAAKVGEQLTIAVNAAPASLDPALANVDPNQTTHLQLTYGAMLRMNPDRSYSGDLAAKWGYSDKANQVFEMTLKPNLVFSDGTKLDAAAAAASLNYYLKSGRNTKNWMKSVTAITAVGDLGIKVEASAPTPDLERVFSTDKLAGMIISPAGLADPKLLATASYGAGPYMSDAAGTTAGDSYTYVPNPKYYDKNVQRFKKIIVKVVPDRAAIVAAMQTGQVDYSAALQAPNLSAIKAANLKFSTLNGGTAYVVLADRNGELNKAIGDLKVRQALSLAIDRKAICSALDGELATPTAQMSPPGWDGWDAAIDEKYAFNAANAKALLAGTPFATGLKIAMESSKGAGLSRYGEAVAAQWKANLGVEVEMTSLADIPASQAAQTGKQFAVYMEANGMNPTPLLAGLHLSSANAFNPWNTTDPDITAALAKGNSLVGAEASTEYKKVWSRTAELAWQIPLCMFPGIVAANAKIGGYEVPKYGIAPTPLDLFAK